MALLGLWERKADRGLQCRALLQAVQLDFGLPTVFAVVGTWHTEVKGHTFDVVHCAQQMYTGTASSESQAMLDRPRKWAHWVFSLEELWEDDSPMQDRPLMIHCSGLGGGLLSPDHDYDLFFQNHAQMKVYGPSLAMIDNWEERVTQLGLTKTTHEYAVYQLLATAIGWRVWRNFLPENFADHKLLLTRAVRLVTAATIRPAHARPPHPTWATAVRQVIRCYHPQGKILLLRASFPHLLRLAVPEGAEKLISWVSRPGHTLDLQYTRCLMTSHVSLASPKLLL